MILTHFSSTGVWATAEDAVVVGRDYVASWDGDTHETTTAVRSGAWFRSGLRPMVYLYPTSIVAPDSEWQ